MDMFTLDLAVLALNVVCRGLADLVAVLCIWNVMHSIWKCAELAFE